MKKKPWTASSFRGHHPALLLALAFLTPALLPLFSCAPKPIKVGLPVVLTGLSSRIGVAGRNGAALAVRRINAAGGIKDRPIELLVRDDHDDPDIALAVDRELADLGVVALVGHMSSRSGLKAAEFATGRRLPLLSPTISSTDYSGKDDYFFRIIGSNALMGKTIAAWALGKGKRRAAGAYETTNASYTVPFYQGFADEFARGGGLNLPPSTFATAAGFDYEGLTASLLEPKPDCLFIVASPFDTAAVCQALSAKSSPLPVLACMWAMTDDLFRFGGRSVERLVGVMYLDPEDRSPAYLDFKARYRELYGEEVSFASAYGYDAMMVLAAALRAAGGLDGPSVKKSLLSSGPYPGLQGEIALDRFGDCQREPMVFVVREGAFHRAP
jgi:branched-chain amino acid transport system substrate-binding protein